jgi:hypothetical protein
MMRGTDKDFFTIVKGALIVAASLLFICFICSGCKTLRNSKSNTKDSISVNNNKEGSVRVDSSGTKSDKTNTKETVYYPQPIYIEGKSGKSEIVFVPQYVKETGTEKTEQAQIIKDTTWKEAFNSLALLIANKESKSQTKVGFSTFEIIMMIAGGIIVLKMFTPSIIGFLTKK